MSLYYEKARELGKLILESSEHKKVIESRKRYYENPDAVKKSEEFNNYQDNFQIDIKSGKLNSEDIAERNDKIFEMLKELEEDAVVGELLESEREFTKFCNDVIGILKATITGEDEPASGCSGCASSKDCDGSC